MAVVMRAVHWVVAVLILALIALGLWTSTRLADDRARIAEAAAAGRTADGRAAEAAQRARISADQRDEYADQNASLRAWIAAHPGSTATPWAPPAPPPPQAEPAPAPCPSVAPPDSSRPPRLNAFPVGLQGAKELFGPGWLVGFDYGLEGLVPLSRGRILLDVTPGLEAGALGGHGSILGTIRIGLRSAP